MLKVHVGQGTTRGSMTVFPLWTQRTGLTPHTLSTRHLEVRETEDGPQVDTLVVGNPGDRPTLVLEGQLFEGGWQHRMATRPMVVGVHQQVPIQVACVEQGRWGGDAEQRTHGRRATPWVREAIRSGNDVQHEVWSRVAQRTAGTDNPTQSLVRRMDAERGIDWSDLRPLPGQAGVLIGLAGQPFAAEVFAGQRELRGQLRAVLDAAALDAAALPSVATPERRAVRFVGRFGRLERSSVRQAGVAEEHLGRSQYVDASVLRLQDTAVNVRMSNVRHPLLVGA